MVTLNATAVPAARLLEAREFLGFTREQVAAAIGLDAAALASLETGGTTISGEHLRQLSIIYRRPIAWFRGESTFEPGAEMLRQLEGQSEHDRNTVLDFAEWLQGAGPPPAPDRPSRVILCARKRDEHDEPGS
jgi:transcriptional regulator with XRE-family HTH domain